MAMNYNVTESKILLFSAFFHESPPKRYQRKLVKVPTEQTPRSKRVSLTDAKRSQLKSRLKPIVEQFKQIAKDEMVDIIDLLALIVRSVFLDANGEHFDKSIGQFFQSHLSGNLL